MGHVDPRRASIKSLAGEADGFTFGRRHGKERLRVDLADVTDPDVRDALHEAEDGETDAEDPAAEAEAEMDRLMAAEVATDGGRDQP